MASKTIAPETVAQMERMLTNASKWHAWRESRRLDNGLRLSATYTMAPTSDTPDTWKVTRYLNSGVPVYAICHSREAALANLRELARIDGDTKAGETITIFDPGDHYGPPIYDGPLDKLGSTIDVGIYSGQIGDETFRVTMHFDGAFDLD